MMTGIMLAMFYNGSANKPYSYNATTGKAEETPAWQSIYNIMHNVPAGSLIRSMHFWGNYFMVVLVFAHMLRGFYVGAYKYPRELTWLTGVLLAAGDAGFCLYRLSAALGPESLLGHAGRYQYRCLGTVSGRCDRPVAAWGSDPQR